MSEGVEQSDSVPRHPLTAEMVSQNISVLARTGNGLSFSYVKLEVHGKGITDLDVLESYPNLRYIDVSENSLVDISGLSQLEYILSLDVHGNSISTVPVTIDKRKYLQHANFSRNKITSWNVSRWPLLSWLNLNENLLLNLKLDDFSELVHLECRANKLESIGQINAHKLQRLYLGANQIKGISGLDSKVSLSVLHLRGNQIETLDGLSSELKKLTYLNLRDNKISANSEIQKLAILPNLRVLVMSGNPIDQFQNYRLEVIYRLPKLEKLDKDVITAEERDEAILFQEAEKSNFEKKEQNADEEDS